MRRRNAQHPMGPRTEEGKTASALNARRHNLTGQVTAMTDADRIMHDAFSASIVESLAPEGAMANADQAVRPYPRDVLARKAFLVGGSVP